MLQAIGFDYFNSYPSTVFYTGLFLVGSVLYGLYYKKCRYFTFIQKDDIPESKANTPRGKCPPFFPNGWFSIMNSCDLKNNDVRYIDYCGRNVALFRGANGKVYALNSFCSHMGANLGIGGTIKGESSIQCPFHGWIFDGESGDCIQSFQHKKKVDQYNYHDIKEQIKVDGEYLYNCYEGNIKLKKYHVREKNGSILIWFDSREEFQDSMPYEPLDMDFTGLEFRGESINLVNSHCQEIPENGADIRHFDFLHTDVLENFPFVKFDWLMKTNRADDPDLFELMAHKDPFFNEVKTKILNQHLNEKNKQYINVIYLDCFLKFPFGFKCPLFNITGFQVGPGLVYLVLQFKFCRVIFCQSVTPLKKFKIKVSHKIFTSTYIPYWLSSYMLWGEVKQLFNDMKIWNTKIFGSRLSYNLKTEADKRLLAWRNWFGQFYEGCDKYEKELTKLDW